MSALQKIVAAGLLALLAAATYGWWYTNQPAAAPAFAKHRKTAQPADTSAPVDENTLVTAERLAQLADGPDEQVLAQSAARLADHELDLAFTAALRQIEAHPPASTPEGRKIEDRLQKSLQLLESDQASVAQLAAAVAQAHGTQQSALQDQLDLARSQVELDRDEAEEANRDLLEAGGNQHQRIQTTMREHAAADHNRPAATAAAANALAGQQGLVRRVRQWLALRRKQQWLAEAGAQAAGSAVRLSVERQQRAAQLEASKESVPELAQHTKRAKAESAVAAAASSPQPARDATTLLGTTRQIAADQKLLTLLDQRIADRRQLAGIYGQWEAVAASQTRAVLHAVLQSVAIVVAIVLLLLFVDRWLESLFGRTKLDRRQVETLRSVTRVGLQALGVVIILLVVVGLPSQFGTMLGIAGAGLTVALKDFIVAFIGWFVLMGKNGVRLGDWVEINGVSGEVVELGMFHTVLLETGNWTDAGRPTGRRVTFTNSFAIEKHYFNFSTSGQWLWDELLVLVPYDKDSTVIAEAIHQNVIEATAESARQAEKEWGRSVPGRRGSVFSGAPGISVRPAVGGVEIAVRYITRASERFQLRTRLYQAAVHLLGQKPQTRPIDIPPSLRSADPVAGANKT
jgi:small-conductance mechanosensitive channel